MAKPKPLTPKLLIVSANAHERGRRLRRISPPRVMWTRDELTHLMRVYGREVAAGRWRDYALNDGREAACFAIFRHSSEVPLYRIDKIPALRRKQGQYVLRGMDGQILRRGHHLAALMNFFPHRHLKAVN